MSQKTKFPCVGGKPARWQPKPPPPPPQTGGSKVAGSHVGTRQNDLPGPAMTRHLSRDLGRGKKGTTHYFSNSSLIRDFFKILISHIRHAKLASSLLQCQSLPISFLQAVRRENVSYIVTRAYKRSAETTRLSKSATLHSTGNISAEGSVQEQSQPQQHTWNSELFVIFPDAHSLHF
jgi:hypothetical protein